MVQLHLFVVESQAKGHGAHRIPAQAEAQNPPQCKAQAHSVVPATVKANIGFQQGRLTTQVCSGDGFTRFKLTDAFSVDSATEKLLF